MDRAVGYVAVSGSEEGPTSYTQGVEDRHQPGDNSRQGEERRQSEEAVENVSRLPLPRLTQVSSRARAAFEPRPPSLVIFTSVAVTVTLFMGLVVGITAAQVSGGVAGSLVGFLLVIVSLPIALLATILLSVIIPYKAFASSSIIVGILASYSPYVLAALSGIWAALWLGKLMPIEYDSLSPLWKWTIAGTVPGVWLLMGLVSNHLAAKVDRRREFERGMDEVMRSRHRIMLVHEQTRKEVANLLHGRIQSRMVVLGHWMKETRERLKDAPEEAAENLERANVLLQEIRDQDLRSIIRQLYPSIIHNGLPSALNSLADRFRGMFDVEMDIDDGIADLEDPIKPRLKEDLRLTLYRVAEEALGNVAKHSHAGNVRVNLGLSPTQHVLLEVQDNGRGFDPAKGSLGHGMLSMEDYVTALGGTLEVISAAGAGTTIRASVPVSGIIDPAGTLIAEDSAGGHGSGWLADAPAQLAAMTGLSTGH